MGHWQWQQLAMALLLSIAAIHPRIVIVTNTLFQSVPYCIPVISAVKPFQTFVYSINANNVLQRLYAPFVLVVVPISRFLLVTKR